MTITCPNCDTKFNVSPDAIGPQGRKVKCVKCKQVWFQEPLNIIQEPANFNINPEVERMAEESSHLPAVSESYNKKIAKIMFFIVFLIVTSTMLITNGNAIVQKLPFTSAFYDLLGIYDTRDLVLKDINIEYIEFDQLKDLLIKGKIYNKSNVEKHVPTLRVTLYDGDKKELKKIFLNSSELSLKANEEVDFENRVAEIPKDTEYVILDLGNILDLALSKKNPLRNDWGGENQTQGTYKKGISLP